MHKTGLVINKTPLVMYLYVCSVQYVVSLLFDSVCYIIIARLMFFDILFMFIFCFVFLFSIFYILCCVLFRVLFFLLCCLFPIFVQAYRPLPSGGNPLAVNNYPIISYLLSYIISYRNIFLKTANFCH